MVTHMKTTVDIADALLNEAKKAAGQEGTTVRALIEAGLRRVLDERREQPGFRLKKASFRGRGLKPEVKDGSWEQLRALVYSGHGA